MVIYTAGNLTLKDHGSHALEIVGEGRVAGPGTRLDARQVLELRDELTRWLESIGRPDG